MKIFAVIPARGGSVSIPRKNIVDYRGKPLISHSIEIALRCKYINEVIVDTDDDEIAEIARSYGAVVPYIRPKHLAQNLSTDLDVFTHFLEVYTNPDIIVHLRPTYPNRSLSFLNHCISKFMVNIDHYDSLRTVVKQDKSPFKMYILDTLNDERLTLLPLFTNLEVNDRKMKEPYNECRQALPTAYLHNGCIDIVLAKTIREGSMCGKRIMPIFMSENHDIDTYEDLNEAAITKQVCLKCNKEITSTTDTSTSTSRYCLLCDAPICFSEKCMGLCLCSIF